jgi:hypothetical protein
VVYLAIPARIGPYQSANAGRQAAQWEGAAN